MTTKAATTTKRRIREMQDWPSMNDLAEQYGVSRRFVRGVVERGCVESIYLDRIRVNEQDWIAFLRSRHTPGRR